MGMVCPIGEIMTRTSVPPCPALAQDQEGKWWCGLIVAPEDTMYHETEWAKWYTHKISDALRDHVFKFGQGCDKPEGVV
jgi:hypothetical protein